MKKVAAIMLTMVLSVSMLAGCGKNYEANTSTVFVGKDGQVVTTSVEEFDTEKFDKDDLESYVKEQIEKYTASNDKDSVKLKSLKVKDGKATLTISYASVKDYIAFDGEELFSGTVAEALAEGYEFDGEFAVIKDGKAELANRNDIVADDSLKVVVIKGAVNVHVDGEVVYASALNTEIIDKNTIAVGSSKNLIDVAADTETSEISEATDANEKVSEVTGTESSEMTDNNSVSEDDLLDMATESSEQVEFNFKEDGNTAEQQVYTYIIYK